jgi:hypothetical protein
MNMAFRMPLRYILILSALALILSAVVFFHLYRREPSNTKVDEIGSLIDTLVREGGSTVRTSRDKKVRIWRVELKDTPVFNAHLAIQQAIEKTGVRILTSRHDPASGRQTIEIGWREPLFRVILIPAKPAPAKGRIALVIDDFGDRWDGFTQSFGDLDSRVTVSILPGRPRSRKVADEMAKRGSEVFLHLPMEPLEAAYKDDGYFIITRWRDQAESIVPTWSRLTAMAGG